jgi:hypothetical protein
MKCTYTNAYGVQADLQTLNYKSNGQTNITAEKCYGRTRQIACVWLGVLWSRGVRLDFTRVTGLIRQRSHNSSETAVVVSAALTTAIFLLTNAAFDSTIMADR